MMADNTKPRFQQGYIDDPKYHEILKMILNTTDPKADFLVDRLRSEDASSTSKRGVPFLIRDGLLLDDGIDGYMRLCATLDGRRGTEDGP